MHFAMDCPPGRPDVLVIVVSLLNTAPLPVRNILLQAAVPKVRPPALQTQINLYESVIWIDSFFMNQLNQFTKLTKHSLHYIMCIAMRWFLKACFDALIHKLHLKYDLWLCMVLCLWQSMRVKLQPPSGTEIAPFNPILPPASITQVMLLANPLKVRGHTHTSNMFLTKKKI